MPHLLHLVSQKESEDTPYRPALVAQGLHVPSVHSQGEKTEVGMECGDGPGGGYTFQSPWGTGEAQLRMLDGQVRVKEGRLSEEVI